jgi:hypothetical protein
MTNSPETTPASGTGRPLRWARSVVPAGVVLAVALVLAGCSSSGNTSPSGSSTSTSSSTSTTASTTSSSPRSSTSTTEAMVAKTCLPNQLHIVPQRGNGAAGTIYETVTLTNTSSTTCTLHGYPGLQLLSAQGSSLPTNVVRGGTQFPAAAANQSPSLVTLAPQQVATFSLSYEDVPVGTETSCPTSAKVEITPPNDVGHAVVTLAISPCSGGMVHVSPVYAGS